MLKHKAHCDGTKFHSKLFRCKIWTTQACGPIEVSPGDTKWHRNSLFNKEYACLTIDALSNNNFLPIAFVDI